jgi:hypothetical protein
MVLLYSCEKTITFHLDDSAPKLVVEATIENGQPPIIFLSKSLDFFSKISPDILAGSFVHNAEIYVSNGTATQQLKEYSVSTGTGYAIYYYSVDSSNLGSAFFGQLNKAYSLRIIHDGQEYLANTTIPNITKRIDSIGWKPAPPNNDTGKVALMIKATDAPGFGDYIRYFTKRNSEPFYPGLNSVFDDQIIDGTTYEVQVERGVNRNASVPEDFSFFDKGDTVTLKLCNIDKTTFDFWRTMEFSYANLGNPFSSPTKVLGNISNGALGYFGGYAAQFRTIIIPR